MNNSWYDTKISPPIFNLEWVFPKPNNVNNGVWRLENEIVFDKDWLNCIKELDISLSKYAMVFYRPANFNTNYAHIDINVDDTTKSTVLGLNWIIGGEDSEMVWYELPNDNKNLSYTVANTPYVNWKMGELKEVDRCRIHSKLTLVRVDVPHGIIMRNSPRWAFSLRLSGNKKNWDEAVSFFKSKNLLEERC
jgi:hypothetical protein